MDLSRINYVAVLVATLSSFVIGGLWYSPLMFSKIWIKEAQVDVEAARKAGKVRIFGTAFILAFIISFNLAAFLGPDAGLVWGLTAGALAGIGWVAASLGMIYLFELKSVKLFLINAGYLAVMFIVAGGIIGAWQ